ncbi:hypothetical protein ACHAWF_009432, partial [Thalassiosira exigua]
RRAAGSPSPVLLHPFGRGEYITGALAAVILGGVCPLGRRSAASLSPTPLSLQAGGSYFGALAAVELGRPSSCGESVADALESSSCGESLAGALAAVGPGIVRHDSGGQIFGFCLGNSVDDVL